ncbi:MAG: glycine--tRNA ligase [Opitutaceae bacterium]|nr:glycine--tRNA ligase [Opitutaceae bacterium]
MSTPPAPANLMDALVSLCKRRGFIFPSSDIYGGLNGFFDYGPLGVEMKNNIKAAWWRDFVQRRDDMVGLDSSIIHHPTTWKASGHVDNFTDPLVDCKVSKQRYRADQLFFAAVCVEPEGAVPGRGEKQITGYVSALENDRTAEELQEKAETLKRKRAVRGKLLPLQVRDFTQATPEEIPLIPSPALGGINGLDRVDQLMPPRSFNMMFQTYVGALRDDSAVAYLRPETAQGIFINFKNVLDTGRVKVPFGIAQVGKAFRNEINPRNFTFRSREFEQMEIEYFIAPDADWQKCHRDWIDAGLTWLDSVGVPRAMLSEYAHPKEKLSHYSKGTVDIMFKFPFGVQELWGFAARGDFDLTQHQQFSGKSMEYFDEAAKKKYVPHVVEPSVGVDRILLAALCAGYAEDEAPDEKGKLEKRVVLRLSPRLAPVKVAVLPLVKNKPELVAVAEQLHAKLQRKVVVFYDQSGAIGRRYRRQDEIGTPWCVTIDFDTLANGTFTLRERDSMKQTRMTEAELFQMLQERLD